MNSKYRMYTGIFIGIVIVAIAVYDVSIIVVGGKDASISQVLIDYSYEFPSFPFIMGFIMGHLFWRMPDKKKEDK